MFDVGDFVVFGSDGVCRVEAVGNLEINDKRKDKKRLRNSGDMFVYSAVNICSVNGLFC